MKSCLSDQELISQYLPDQPDQCFETLYNRYVNQVYRQCLSMTQDSEKAQDFTHDIFLKVFDKLDAFQQRSSLSTWIYSIAFNYCSDQLRLAKRLHTTALSEQLEQQLADSRESAWQEEVLQSARRALASLPLEEQELLRLKYEQGLSIEELSARYGLKASAMKMRLKRSRAKIQQVCLQQQFS